MTEPNEIHQIEYRWEQQQDLVPIASSMSQHAKQSWNALISSWVRHPDAEVTPESVRYHLLPDGRAVLAWRYRDPEAAKRADGTHGRPIVSRVFVAQSGLLTPDVAIALCRTGLPPSAGPRAGEVAAVRAAAGVSRRIAAPDRGSGRRSWTARPRLTQVLRACSPQRSLSPGCRSPSSCAARYL